MWALLPSHGTDNPRYTADLDILIRPSKSNAERVLMVLVQFGFGSLEIASEDLTIEGKVIQLGVKPNRIDLLTSISGVAFEEAWATRVSGVLDSIPVQ